MLSLVRALAAHDADRRPADAAEPRRATPRCSGTSSTSSLAIFFALALVALVVFLLWEPGQNALRRIGLDFTRFGGDLGRGILLAAVIGIPGLALYVVGRALGPHRRGASLRRWMPRGGRSRCCVLSALRAGLTEEVIFIGVPLRPAAPARLGRGGRSSCRRLRCAARITRIRASARSSATS